MVYTIMLFLKKVYTHAKSIRFEQKIGLNSQSKTAHEACKHACTVLQGKCYNQIINPCENNHGRIAMVYHVITWSVYGTTV